MEKELMKIKKIDLKKIFANLASFWNAFHSFIFILVVLFFAIYGAYIWNKILIGGAWTQERKQEFINSKNSMTKLDESKLNKVLENLDLASKKRESQVVPERNIFKSF